LIAHGSREAKSNQAFLRLVGRLTRSTKTGSKRPRVIGAFLELARPTIPEALEAAVKAGVREVVVIPFMLFPGRHVARDIPRLVRETAVLHRGVRFRLKKALALHPRFMAFVKEVL
jgi:sirohydrochlorin cobaltochelatase